MPVTAKSASNGKPKDHGLAIRRGRVEGAIRLRREPTDIPKLVEEIEADYQFNLGRLTIEALAFSIEPTIEINGADARASALAAHLLDVWHRTLPQAMRAFAFGRVAFELTFRRVGDLIEYAALDAIPFENSELAWEDGAFKGVKLKGLPITNNMLEPHEVWWLAIDPTPKEPHGRSRYLGAPLKVWKRRRRLDEQEQIFLDRFALGQRMAKAPASYGNRDPIAGKGDRGEVNENSQLDDPIADLRALFEKGRSGGTVVVQSGNHPDGAPLYDIIPFEIKPDATPLENQRRATDAAALRSLGIPERAITQDAEVGSLAMADAHRQVLYQTVEGVYGQIAESFQAHVIDRLAALNVLGATLTMTWQSLAESDRAKQLTQLIGLVAQQPQVSPLITEGAIDLEQMLRASQIPVGKNVAAALKEIKKASAAFGPTPLAGIGAAATGAVEVEQTALNGAQIASLVEIVGQVAAGMIPLASAKPIIAAAFPTLPASVVDAIVRPLATFEPPTTETSPPTPRLAMSLAKDNAPPKLDRPDELEERAARIAVSAWAAIKGLASDPGAIDWRRLQGRATGTVGPPDAGNFGGETSRLDLALDAAGDPDASREGERET